MTFTIIGAGNIGWFIGTRLAKADHICNGVYSRNAAAAKQLAGVLSTYTYDAIADIKDGFSDICVLAVSDKAIKEVAADLSFKKTVLIHTAGAVELDAVKDGAADRAVLWPVYSILKSDLPDHRNIPC